LLLIVLANCLWDQAFDRFRASSHAQNVASRFEAVCESLKSVSRISTSKSHNRNLIVTQSQ
jgi:hypothetical protein